MSYSINLGPQQSYKATSVTDGTQSRVNVQVSYSLHDEGFKTPTVKRLKPTDLMRNWTTRNSSRYTYWQDALNRGPVREGLAYYDPITHLPYYFTEVWYGTVTDFLNVPSTFEMSAPSSVDGKLRSKIRASNLNLAQACAEYRQTASMFSSAASDVVKTFRRLRAGRAFGDFVRILQGKSRDSASKRIANRWLEYQYGLKPLISDIYASAEVLAVRVREGLPQRVSSKKFEEITYERRNVGSYRGVLNVSENYYLKKTAFYTIRDSSLKELSQLGITNPLLLAWELVPYSFVIDWLLPVGDFLESLDSLVGVQDLKVGETHYRERMATGTVFGMSRTDWRQSSNRSMSSTLPLPRMHYQPSKSLLAVSNGVALLTQLRKKP